jgi:alpha-amylase
MPSINFYFQVHQPYRLQKFRFFDIGSNKDYFNDGLDIRHNNEVIFHKVAKKCYYPSNNLLLELLNKYPDFKVSFSLSGVFLEQAMQFDPEVIKSFKKLVDTGRCEILSETYYHSLAFLFSKKEFKFQVNKHKKLIKKLFKVEPKVFRNTELIYNNDLAITIQKMGYKGIITEGADHILNWRSPNFLYQPKGCDKLKLMVKNYKLSDDIAYRFSNKAWQEFPLTVNKFSNWINQINGSGEIVNLFMDYETFGEHQWQDTGIFEFLKHLPEEILKHPDNSFVTPTEAVEKYQTHGELDVHNFISWADSERDLSAWKSNYLQEDAFKKIYEMQEKIEKTKNEDLIEDWRKLQTSDHFYYMCTKFWSDGDVHKYFSPYESPYEAYIYFMNALQDLDIRINSCLVKEPEQNL